MVEKIDGLRHSASVQENGMKSVFLVGFCTNFESHVIGLFFQIRLIGLDQVLRF